MNLVTALVKTLFPFEDIRQEIREIHRRDKIVREESAKKIKEIIATLDGEEWWMIKEHKDDSCK